MSQFDRQGDGHLRWYATPPLDVIPVEPVAHSLAYLEYKKSHPLVKSKPQNGIVPPSPAKATPVVADPAALASVLETLTKKMEQDAKKVVSL